MTLREQIILAVISALNGKTVCGDRIYRTTAQALERDELPAVVVIGGSEEFERDGDEVDRRQSRINVVLYGAGDEAEPNLDPLIESVNQLLFADSVLDDWVDLLQGPEISAPDYDVRDDGSCAITLTYTATYFTPAGDLSTKF